MLAPLRAKSEAPESFGIAGPEECAVLYLSYCLSEDQSWLLAVATDDRGEIFETATINIDIPNRKRRKRASARRIGLQKLMDFILGVMSQGVSVCYKTSRRNQMRKSLKIILKWMLFFIDYLGTTVEVSSRSRGSDRAWRIERLELVVI